MKRLPKMLCALILCALMVTAAVSCGQKPAQQLQDPPQQEDPQPAPALKIAVDSEPARSAVIHWFYSEEGQALFGDKDLNDVLFSVDPRDIAQELKLGNYDAAVCAPDQKALQLLLCALAWTLLQALHMVTRLRPRRCAPWVHPLVRVLFGLCLAILAASVVLPAAGVMLSRLYGARSTTAALFFLLGALLWLTQPDTGPR